MGLRTRRSPHKDGKQRWKEKSIDLAKFEWFSGSCFDVLLVGLTQGGA